MINWGNLEGKTIRIANNADLSSITGMMVKMARMSAQHPEIRALAAQMRQEQDPVRAVFNTAYDKVLFKPDPKGIQNLRFAHRSLRDGTGNCTDYSILISALLQNLRIPHFFRVVKWKPDRGYEHVYVVTRLGQILDACVGQRQDGSETRESRPGQGSINRELKYYAKKDIKVMPQLNVLGSMNSGGCGCGGSCGCGNNGYALQGTSFNRRRRIYSQLGATAEGETWAGNLFRDIFGTAKESVMGTAGVGACKTKCTIKYPFNKEKRQLCKSECELIAANTTAMRDPKTTPPPPTEPPKKEPSLMPLMLTIGALKVITALT